MITSAVAILFAVGYLLATVWLCRGIRLTARNLYFPHHFLQFMRPSEKCFVGNA